MFFTLLFLFSFFYICNYVFWLYILLYIVWLISLGWLIVYCSIDWLYTVLFFLRYSTIFSDFLFVSSLTFTLLNLSVLYLSVGWYSPLILIKRSTRIIFNAPRISFDGWIEVFRAIQNLKGHICSDNIYLPNPLLLSFFIFNIFLNYLLLKYIQLILTIMIYVSDFWQSCTYFVISLNVLIEFPMTCFNFEPSWETVLTFGILIPIVLCWYYIYSNCLSISYMLIICFLLSAFSYALLTIFFYYKSCSLINLLLLPNILQPWNQCKLHNPYALLKLLLDSLRCSSMARFISFFIYIIICFLFSEYCLVFDFNILILQRHLDILIECS